MHLAPTQDYKAISKTVLYKTPYKTPEHPGFGRRDKETPPASTMLRKSFVLIFVCVISSVAAMPSPTLWSGPTTVVAVGGGGQATDLCRSGDSYADSVSCLCECYNRIVLSGKGF